MQKKIEKEEIEILPQLTGKEFKKVRLLCGITQQNLARFAGFTARSMVSSWEKKGLMKPYQTQLLKDISKPAVFISALQQIGKYHINEKL